MPVPVFPNLRTGSPAKYPVEVNYRNRSKVYVHADLSEQRFVKGFDGLRDFVLVYAEIGTADKETLRAFWNSMMGAFNTTWNITLPIDTPPGNVESFFGCQFVPGSQFDAQEVSHGIWRVTLQVRETRKGD